MRRLLPIMAVSVALAAGAEIRWLEKDYDFGLMKEAAGPKTGMSRFVNTGPDTVSVFSVRPGCGCTSADFSEKPLAPGDTAVISYTYDPDKRPGKFDKSVKVRLSDGSRHSIRITGNVLGTPESLASFYPVEAGAMRLSESVVNGGETTRGRSPVFFINAYSESTDSLRPSLSSLSPAIYVTPAHPVAGPGDIVTFTINFVTDRLDKYGPVEIPLEFRATPDSQPVAVTFNAFLLPDRERLLMLQQGRHPRCVVDNPLLPLGQLSGGKVKMTAGLANIGSGALHILAVAPQSAAVTAVKQPKQIKAGASANLEFKIDADLLTDGAFRIPVHVITDDPDQPHLILTLTGTK